MTNVLVHELPSRAQELMSRLQQLLRSSSGDFAGELLARARMQSRQRPRMVLTGQFSSGKSSLIKALTDGGVDPVIDADIATDAVTEYEWDGAVVLVDTPGLQSGLRSHDELAVGAIGDADFILFVVTVNLFDDASRDYLRRLAHDLRLSGQMIVVITQAGMQTAGEGIREQAVQDALGTSNFNLPIAEVDSVYYLRSLGGGPRAEMLRTRSGIDELRAQINKISEERGQLAQLRQPLHLIRLLCDEAQQLFVADPQSQTALGLLARQRSAISDRRYMIERSFLQAESQFKSACLVDVTAFVDTATSLPADGSRAREVLDASEAGLVEALDRHAEQFADAINRLTEMQFGRLSEQLLEIGTSNRAHQLSPPAGDVALETPGGVPATRSGQAAHDRAAATVDWRKVTDQITKGQKWWGAGDGLKSASGSVGHNIVKDVGHLFGKKFKPWEALKIADRIGKAAKIGGFAIQIGLTGYEVWRGEREARTAQLESERQHAAFVTEIMRHADKIAADARRQLWEIIDTPMDAFLADVQAAQDEILGAELARGTATRELSAIASEADRLLTEST
ncbi:GTPase domain-containing protein [Micromonospora saelicesensis]|uniref:GTPase domain-containing protein n=1 Tax=Micromonospora saelicesensis TaxID=285676 RepID=UPI0015ECAF89|nr:GTPase domain-containing protein [Micromonospora saelicesensis]